MTVAATAPYFGVLVAAAVEGEVVFVGASALVAFGCLHPLGVMLSGALGAAIGDQFMFFAARAGVSRWLSRSDRPRSGLLAWVQGHQLMAAFAVRFAPGLRLTLTALCVAAGVSPRRFCIANGVSSLLWAAVVMGAVAYGGPWLLGEAGLGPRFSAVVVAVSALAVLATLTPWLRRVLEQTGGAAARKAVVEP
ncbi:MAG: VTT domain-containing protein [Acidobacteriota bacterium]